MRNQVNLGYLRIASGQTTSAALTRDRIRFLDSFNIFGPSALTGTVTVEVSYDGTNYTTHQSAGADIEVGPGKSVTIMTGGFEGLRLKSSSSEGANRDFNIIGTEEIGSI